MDRIRTCLLAASLAITSFIPAAHAGTDNDALARVIASRSDEDRARDNARHPARTLAFFQVEPGMIIAEGLPGGGWYTRVLADYLGSDGAIYGVNYAQRMWPMFSFANEDFIARRTAATAKFPADVREYTDNGIMARR